jgi:hypothetical protein
MLNHNVNMLLRVGIRLMAFLLVAGSSVAQPLPRSVLILSQTDPGTPWYIVLNQSLRSTLESSSASRVTVYAEDMDLVRFGTSQYEQILLAYFREKYRERPIGTVVAIGSMALEVVLRLRAELWSNVPVVFAAVDENTVKQLPLPPEVTGTTMRLTFRDAVTAARALVPDIKRIVLVGDPLERQTFRRHFKEEVPVFAAGLVAGFNQFERIV